MDSSDRICCVLCGSSVSCAEEAVYPWMSRFRAVVTAADAVHPAVLTGVGSRVDGDSLAPMDTNRRWDDPDMKFEDLCDIRLLKPIVEIRAPAFRTDSPVGFPIHESCWAVMAGAFHPESVDLQQFFDICRSLPVGYGRLNWGHDYGGLLRSYIPCPGWDLEFINEALDYRHFHDPLDVQPLEELAAAGAAAYEPANIYNRGQDSSDPFAQFPKEVLELIFVHLPSHAVANLRLASPWCASTALSAGFWRSRFEHGSDLDYIYEARSQHPGPTDWAALYAGARKFKEYPAMFNRRRIYNLAEKLRIFMRRTASVECQGTKICNYFEPHERLDDSYWTRVSGYIQGRTRPFSAGCVSLKRRVVDLPLEVDNISVTMVGFGPRRFVAGIVFHIAGGGDASLGYVDAGETVVTTWPEAHSGPRNIIAFNIAKDVSGLRGIACVTSSGQVSNWVGDYQDLPKCRLPSSMAYLTSMKADFDAFKMVALSITAGAKEVLSDSDSSRNSIDDFLDSIENSPDNTNTKLDVPSWYPELPGDRFKFYGVSPGSYTLENPFATMMFTGPSGEYSANLVGITVWEDGKDFMGIESTYNIPVEDESICALGHPRPYSGDLPRGEAPFSPKRHTLSIDGPNGERVTEIGVLKLNYEPMSGLRIRTNRDRELKLELDNTFGAPPWTTVKWPENETFLGFFAPLGEDRTISGLGIVTVLPDLDEVIEEMARLSTE